MNNEQLQAQRRTSKNKLIGGVAGLLIFLGFMGWRFYHSYNDVRLGRFIESQNVYVNNELPFINFLQTQAEFGVRVPENILMPMLHNVNFMATTEESGCKVIPDAALKDECMAVFGRYHEILQGIEKEGVTEAHANALKTAIPAAQQIMHKVAEKYPDKVKLQK